MTNQELYETVEKSTTITTEVTDIFLELDSTASMATQASLDELLETLYRRLKEEKIVIEAIGEEPATQEQLKAWVEDNFDDYSIKLFEEED